MQQHQLPRLFIVLKCKWLLQGSVKHWRGGPLPRLSTASWGKLGWLESSLSNNRPFILGERNESATPGPFQQPRRLPAGQPISKSQLVWGPQIDLNKSRHLSLQKLEGHTCLCGKWSCFTFCSIVPFQRTSSIFLTTWLPLICQWSYGNHLLREMNPSSAKDVLLPFKAHQSAGLLSKIEYYSQGKIVIISISNCIRCRR